MNNEQIYATISAVSYIFIVCIIVYFWLIRERNLQWCMDNTKIKEDLTSGIGDYFWTQGNRIVQYIGVVDGCPTFNVIPSILGCTVYKDRKAENFNTVACNDLPVQYNAIGCAWGWECDIQDRVTDEEFEYFVLRGE